MWWHTMPQANDVMWTLSAEMFSDLQLASHLLHKLASKPCHNDMTALLMLVHAVWHQARQNSCAALYATCRYICSAHTQHALIGTPHAAAQALCCCCSTYWYCSPAALHCLTLLLTMGSLLLLLTDVDYLNILYNTVSTNIDTTAIPSRKYPFSSDQGSQAGLCSASTRLSHRPETLSAMVPFAAVYSIQMMYVCLCILLCCAAHK